MPIYQLGAVGIGDLRCECRMCGTHVAGTQGHRGVTGHCGNCGSYDVALISPDVPESMPVGAWSRGTSRYYHSTADTLRHS